MGPLIPPELLMAADPAPTILDVRWELGREPQRDAYEAAHIPGAAFVDLDAELSAPPGPRGRHPLPDAGAFQAAMRAAGVSRDRAVVCYGAGAARAWWLLRYFGHRRAVVLDGGIEGWVAAGGPLESGAAPIEPGDFIATPGGMPLLDAASASRIAAEGVLLDARAPERFRGEVEPIDPVAGHIPGARNRPATDNVSSDGRFRPRDLLRREFERLGVRDGVEIGAYCGSGVTAAQEVLALELAGFEAGLYAGSWSEWVTDPKRPVERSPRAARQPPARDRRRSGRGRSRAG
jgi:thiosulfate/3-mercaptopyruvate sulfurtransferase